MVETKEQRVRAWHDQVATDVMVAGEGPPLVYFHGAYGLMWDEFLDRLAESHTVYAPAFPGTLPEMPDEIKPIDTLWDLVLYYDELLDQLGLEQADFIGHSFGGMTAAEVAATFPDRVKRLVLIDPIGLWREDAPVVNWMITGQDKLPGLVFADPEGPVAKQMFTMPEDPEAALDQQVRIMWSQACTGKFIWPIPDKGLKKRLHRISAPTLIIWGAQDGLAPPIYADEFSKRINDARVEMIDNAAHVPQLEQPEAVAEKVASFLGG